MQKVLRRSKYIQNIGLANSLEIQKHPSPHKGIRFSNPTQFFFCILHNLLYNVIQRHKHIRVILDQSVIYLSNIRKYGQKKFVKNIFLLKLFRLNNSKQNKFSTTKLSQIQTTQFSPNQWATSMNVFFLPMHVGKLLTPPKKYCHLRFLNLPGLQKPGRNRFPKKSCV